MSEAFKRVEGPASVQGSPEWAALRLDHGTASEVPVILQQSPYQTPLQLAEQKISRIVPEPTESQRVLFERGHAAERAGREFLKQKLGLDLTPMVLISTRCPDLLASLDGVNLERGVSFEAKFVGRDTLHELKTKRIVPPHHVSQVQAQLYVTGVSRCLYFATDPDGDSAVIEITPDKDYAEDIAEQVTKFMQMVRAGELPDPTERDFVQLDDPRLADLFKAKRQMDEAKTAFETMKDQIIESYKQYARFKGGGIAVTKSIVKGSVDYSKVPQIKGVNLDKYRKPAREQFTVIYDKKGGSK